VGGGAYVVEHGQAYELAREVARASGIGAGDPSLSALAVGESSVVAGVVFARHGGYYVVYPSTPEAAELLEEAVERVASKSSSVSRLRFSTSASVDFDKVIAALRRAGVKLEELVTDPVGAGVRAIASEIQASARGATAHVSEVLYTVAHLIADRLVASGRVSEEDIEGILSEAKRGVFKGLAVWPARGRLDLLRTAVSAEVGREEPVVVRQYSEDEPRIVFVIDTSGSMEAQHHGIKNVVYAAAIAALVSNSVRARYDLYAFNAASYKLGEEMDTEELFSALASIREGGGTDYASAIEHAVSEAEPGSIVFVVGDFIDSTPIPRSTAQEAAEKDLRIYLVPVPGANRTYMEYLATALGAEIFMALESE